MGTAVDSVADTGVNATPVTYERVSGSGPMGGHPQLQKVIDAILRGESCNGISKWVSPPVTRFTVAKLADQVRKQRETAQILAKAQELQAIASGNVAESQDVAKLTRDAVMGQQHNARVEKLLTPLERQAALADEENDRNGLSSVVKTALSAIRLQAELDGSLLSTPVNSTVNHLSVMVMPGAAAAPADAIQAINISAEPIES